MQLRPRSRTHDKIVIRRPPRVRNVYDASDNFQALWGLGLIDRAGNLIGSVSRHVSVKVPVYNLHGKLNGFAPTISVDDSGVCSIHLSSLRNDLHFIRTRADPGSLPIPTRDSKLLFTTSGQHGLHAYPDPSNSYLIYELISNSSYGISVSDLTKIQENVDNSSKFDEESKAHIISTLYRYKYTLDGSHRAMCGMIGLRPSGERATTRIAALRPPSNCNPDFINWTARLSMIQGQPTYVATFAVHITEDRMSAGIHLLSGLGNGGLLYQKSSKKRMVYIMPNSQAADPEFCKEQFRAFLEEKGLKSKLNKIYNLLEPGKDDDLFSYLQLMDTVHDFYGPRGARISKSTRQSALEIMWSSVKSMVGVPSDISSASALEEAFSEFILSPRLRPDEYEHSADGLFSLAKEVIGNNGVFVIDVTKVSFTQSVNKPNMCLKTFIVKGPDGAADRGWGGG